MENTALGKIILQIIANIAIIIKGLPIDFDKVEERNQQNVCKAMVHCIVNGPVGVQKSTNFPDIEGQHRIKEWIPDVTNSSWRALCYQVASFIKQQHPDIECNSITRYGDYWPLKDVDRLKK